MSIASFFSQSLRNTMTEAEVLTNLKNKAEITCASVVLGLIKLKKGKAYEALELMDVDLEGLEACLLRIIDEQDDRDPSATKSLRYSEELKSVLQHAHMASSRSVLNGVIDTSLVLQIMTNLNEQYSLIRKVLNDYKITSNEYGQAIQKLMENSVEVVGGHGNKAVSSEKKILRQMAVNVTAMASAGKLMPVIGCKKEINKVVQILSRKTKNNPMILGDPGVGKTAVVEGLAMLGISDDAPKALRGKQFYMISLNNMVAGAKYRGEFEQRMQMLVEELKADPNCVAVIDEFHTIVGAGSADGALDAANILKPYLARGEFQCIAITTHEDYRKKILKDKALSRRFIPVTKDEPTHEETIDIIKGVRNAFESFHGVRYDNEVVECIYTLASRYLPERKFPDKAIDLLDDVGSKLRMKTDNTSELKSLRAAVEEARAKVNKANQEEDYDNAEKYHAECKSIELKFNELAAKSNKKNEYNQADYIRVTVDDIRSVVSELSGVPVSHIASDTEKAKLRNLEVDLGMKVAAQDEAVALIAKAVRRSKMGLKERNKPNGSFLFLGSTGVGKTEMAKSLAITVFGDENALVRIDCSEYNEAHSSAKLIGAKPGYVGYDQPSALEPVRTKPYCVVLFDELEKAHPSVHNTLLTILDEGRITDSTGNVIHFENTFVILTGNIGATAAQKNRVGFFGSVPGDKNNYVKDEIMAAAKKSLPPEFINRIENVVCFNMLSEKDCEEIARITLSKFNATFLKDINVQLICSDEVINKVAREGYVPEYGARPLKRKFQDLVLDAMTNFMLESEDEVTGAIYCGLKDGEVVFSRTNDFAEHNKEIMA